MSTGSLVLALCARAEVLKRGPPHMDPLGTFLLPAHEIAAAIGATGQALFYLSPDSVASHPDPRAHGASTRVVLIPRLDELADLQAAQRRWCAVAMLELGELVPRIDVAALLRPPPRSRWAAMPVERRAVLLTQAIDLVATHARELATFDRRELPVRVDGVAVEHMFFGLLAHRADSEDGEVMLIGPGGDGRWLLRLMYTEAGRIWRRGVVLVPDGALAGVELAAVAGEVVARVIDRRHAWPTPDPEASAAEGSPPPLAPELEAALEAGAAVFTPRLTSLIPPPEEPLLH